MKHRALFILTFAFSLLFTSCLADMLNEKFGYAPPIVITYEAYEKGNNRQAQNIFRENRLPKIYCLLYLSRDGILTAGILMIIITLV